MVALVTDAFGGRGGIAQYNRDLLSAFAETGPVASIAVLPRRVPDRPAPLPERIAQEREQRARLSYSTAALWAALRQRVDIVFCGHLYMAPLAALIARLKRAKLIVQVHGIETWQPPSRLLRIATESADLVLCVSRHTRNAVLSWAAIPPERAIVLPNTVRPAFMPGTAVSRVLAGYDLEGRRVLITVSRIDKTDAYKGHAIVLRTLAKVRREHTDVAYLIVGDGDGREDLESMTAELGLGDIVRFAGHVSDAELPDLYRSSRLFVMPSTGEGFGIVFLEAAACGLPVIAGNRDGSVDALADGTIGTLVDPADENALAQALCSALGETDDSARREARASLVRARFGRELFAARARSILERTMAAA
jgi:phosphatidylinositol alpha-1,6-mannosyltransferase